MSAVSAAMLLTPGCAPDTGADRPAAADERLRWAAFRSLAARDRLLSCPGSAARIHTMRQADRFTQLKAFAHGKDADRAMWLAENEWNGVSRVAGRGSCGPAEEDYRQALRAFSDSLDVLGARIGEYRP